MALPLFGCSTVDYYRQAVDGHLTLLAARQPLDELIEEPSTPQRLRDRLRLVQQIRDFASERLSLPDDGSYQDFVRVDRSALVWSLVATGEFSLRPVEWCYPLIGCASYRGYFSRQHGERQRQALNAQGFDTALEPVAAYSTLGWFDDPLPSTVVDWPEPRLARLIFHELSHQKLYVPGDSAFNEAFATAVAAWGVQRWLDASGNMEAVAAWRALESRERQFIGLLLETSRRLQALYQRALSEAQMRTAKSEVFRRLERDYGKLKQQWGGSSEFDVWFAAELNNARLASIETYRYWLPAFEALLKRSDGDLDEFYRASEALARYPEQRRRQALRALMPAQ